MRQVPQTHPLVFPERGAGTRNRIGRQVSGVSAIEVKATIPDSQIDKALRHFDMTVDNDEERFIYFFDTPRRALMKAGIIARARRVVGDAHDSTVKFRPVVPDRLPARWNRVTGFKLEADASEKRVVRSASLTLPVEKGLIKRVAAGDRSIKSLFSRRQETFLRAMGGGDIDFRALQIFGPLKAHRWSIKNPACPWPITVELWRRSDGARLMETSVKASAIQAAFAIGGFMALLAELGAERNANEQTKTRWALKRPAAQR